MYKYFEFKDFACSCGCGLNKMRHETIEMLDEAREIAGVPFIINSGYRCKDHPESVKNPKSSHLEGFAADIRAKSSKERYKVLKALTAVGFTRFGIAKGFIHADNDDKKSQDVIWVY